MHIYYLEHARKVGSECVSPFGLGVYRSWLDCLSVTKIYKILPGFQDYPKDFHIKKFFVAGSKGIKISRVVYEVSHEYELVPDEMDVYTTVGFYISEELAKQEVERLRKTPEFSKHPDGFYVDCYPLNQMAWEEGFCSSDD